MTLNTNAAGAVYILLYCWNRQQRATWLGSGWNNLITRQLLPKCTSIWLAGVQ